MRDACAAFFSLWKKRNFYKRFTENHPLCRGRRGILRFFCSCEADCPAAELPLRYGRTFRAWERSVDEPCGRPMPKW